MDMLSVKATWNSLIWALQSSSFEAGRRVNSSGLCGSRDRGIRSMDVWAGVRAGSGWLLMNRLAQVPPAASNTRLSKPLPPVAIARRPDISR